MTTCSTIPAVSNEAFIASCHSPFCVVFLALLNTTRGDMSSVRLEGNVRTYHDSSRGELIMKSPRAFGKG